MSGSERTRALSRLSGARGTGRYGQRFSAERERELLAWAATLDDETILDWRDTGHGTLRWIREHQPAADDGETPVRMIPEGWPGLGGTLGAVMQSTGWRIELFWNGSAGWFTARLFALVDKSGRRGYEGGYLVPFDNPIGASGATPTEALANLSDAVLEWA